MSQKAEAQAELILAAEDCAPELFDHLHNFSARNDQRIIGSLIAHGPVLLRGGRGAGKSAFMIAASRRLDPAMPSATAVGIYMSLRNAPLLKSTGAKYGAILCGIINRAVRETLGERAHDFDPRPEVGSIQSALTKLARFLGKRLVLFL